MLDFSALDNILLTSPVYLYLCVWVKKNHYYWILDGESDCVELFINEVFKSQVILLFPQLQRESLQGIYYSVKLMKRKCKDQVAWDTTSRVLV